MEQARISTSQGTQPSQATRTRAHAQQKGMTDDAGGASAMPGSFLALLAAQDPELAEGDPLAATPGAADAGLMAGQAPTDPAALTGWQALVAADAAAAQALAGQNAAAGTAAGDGGTGAAISTVGLGLPGAGRGLLPNAGGMEAAGLSDATAVLNARLQAPAADGLVAQTTALDGGAPQGAAASTTAGFGRQFSRMHAAALQRGGGSESSAIGLAGAGDTVGRAGGRADARQAASQADMLSAAPVALAAVAREAGAGAGVHRASGEAQGVAGPDAALLASQDLVSGATASAARNADAGGGDASRHGAGGLGEGGTEASTYSIDGASGTAGFDELAQASIEEQLAEQVTYWANQTSQSAEMTLNRDGQPLAVTVSLSGNEAHVSFRSDQENTRALLDQNMAQLSDLLRGEGLVLSGMTVGTSGGQGAGAGEDGQPRERRSGEGQQGTVKVGGPTDVSQRLAGSGTRSSGVDVFV